MIVMSRSSALRRALFAVLLALALGALAACGGGAPSSGGTGGTGGSTGNAATAVPTAAPTAVPTEAPTPTPQADDPETRVKGFFSDFSSALNDPKITEAATQEEWATKLSNYAEPSAQAKTKETFQKTLGEFSKASGQLSQLSGQQNLDIQFKFAFNNIETKLDEKTDTSAKVRLTGGTVKMELVGKDVDKLGDAAKQVSREMPIDEFMKSTNSKSAGVINLKLVDNTWYITDLTNS